MTPPHAQPVSAERPRADAAARSAAAGAEGPFVINLCSSTTPMALSQPRDPALARFTFFMSRRLEDGRERFRLHMGYFDSQAEAEELLGVVREIYPGAWAGEAPGKRLRARAAESAAQAAAAPTVPAPAAAAQSAIAVKAEPPVPPDVPVLHAAPAIDVPAPSPPAGTLPAAKQPAAPAVSRVSTDSAPAIAAVPAKAGKPAVLPGKSAAAARPAKASAAPLPLSNVREVLASLDETGATRQMLAPKIAAEPRVAVTRAKPPARAADSSPRLAPEPAKAPLPTPSPELERSLTDTQVLKLLEGRRADGGRAEEDSSISLLKPDDTGTRRALKEAVAADAPVSFAVQLQWSVQPIDAAKVPPLAIFSAYTLYTVEGSREGRRWYGLRLGFFSDAISAKQVAHYVRSEFNSVAVVPVSPHERTRASDGGKSVQDGGGTAARRPSSPKSPLRDRLPEPTMEFKLIDDEPAPRVPEPRRPAAKPPAAAAPAAAKRTSKGSPGRIRLREKRSPQTLEETLEILGADELEIDTGRGESLNDTGVRHLTVQVRKSSPFTKLLDRLSERARSK